MTLRVAIDQQDISVLHKDISGRFPADIRLLCAVYGVLALICVSAFVTGLTLAGAAVSSPAATPLSAIEFGAFAALLFVCVACGVAAWKAREVHKNSTAARLKEYLKNGLTIGQFEFSFTEKALVVKNARALRKAAWFCLDAIEETKSNIVFWRRGEVFAFIPIGAVRDEALYDRLMRIHGPALKNKLSVKDGDGAHPHKVVFEAHADDLEEFRRHRWAQRYPRFATMREVFSSPAWPAMSFVLAVFAGVAFAIRFAADFDLESAVAAIIAFGTADVVFRRYPDSFRRPAHGFRQDGYWPYRQSEMTTVAINDNGVSVCRGGAEELFAWSAFDAMVGGRLTIYLVLSPQNVIAIPKRAFVDAVHCKTFVNYARTRIGQSRQEATKALGARIKKTVAPGSKARPAPNAGARRAAAS